MFNKLILFIALLSFSVLEAQIITPISQLRYNRSDGVPVDSGNTFTIRGVITVGNEFNSPSYMQDNSAGVAVYGRGTFSTAVKFGDSVIVTGKLTHFRGLTQLDYISNFSVIDTGKTVQPTVLSINDILTQNWNGYEAYEGLLIRIDNVTCSSTGTWVGNTNYNISDSTGTMQIRITAGTNLVGQTIPSGKFDIIGALGQFKTSAPYNSGYQLLPRNLFDVITDFRPLILLPILATNIDTSSFKIYFETLREGNTEVKYGKTTALEIGTVIDNTLVRYHNIQISGLSPATTYYFKVSSTNSFGKSEGPIQSVNTNPINPSTGTINVYFNYSVDQSVAAEGNLAKGNVDFTDKIINRINSSSYSIDMCVYSFSDQPAVVNALKSAKNRGVKVRIVYDSRTNQNSMNDLIASGFLISKRPSGLNGIMHNKFFVFDARDNNPNNDWVWTGSYNLSGNESSYINNAVEINDYALAQAYTKEFSEMWGSFDDTPNPSQAKFGSQKTDNTPHLFTIGGREVQLYFSPSDQTTEKIKNTIRTADSAIYFGLFSYTRQDIANEMIARKNVGAKIRGIIDQTDATSVFNYIKPHGEIFAYNISAITLHHKYCIIDASWQNLAPYVITGSHNWSNAAENDNDENTLIIKDIKIANQFMQEFKKRYNELGGIGTFVIPVISNVEKNNEVPTSLELYQNYPNPFNPTTTITFTNTKPQHCEISVYNTLGEKISTLYSDFTPIGKVSIDVNASDYSSGVYFYSLKTADIILTRKMILIK